VIQKLNGWFWRTIVDATIAVSPECERQVRTIAGSLRGPVFQARPQYRSHVFDPCHRSPWSERPFHVLFVGRIELNKGILETLGAATQLERTHPSMFFWTFCGNGGAEATLRDEIDRRGLGDCTQIRGHLDQEDVTDAYMQCHAVIVPTTARFPEGLNKVAIEGVLAKRPVVVSQYVPAAELLGEAVIVASSATAEGYAAAIRDLAEDEYTYRRCVSAGEEVASQFFDDSQSWAAALRRSMSAESPEGEVTTTQE
jgi:glycosyltransferase involved in cell wall biosynthesis